MSPILLLTICLSLSLISSSATMGQTPQAAPAGTAAPASRSSEDSYAKEPYVFEFIHRNLRFEADGKGQINLTIRARVQSESAVREFGLLAYSFASSFENLDVVYARVRKPDGTVIETPSTDVQEVDTAVSREAPMYTDQRAKHIAIKSLSAGDILEAHLRWTIHDPMAPGHFWHSHTFFREGICLQETLQFDLPLNLPVKFNKMDPQPSIGKENARRIYTFQTSNLKKREESKIPDWEKNSHGIDPPDVQISSFTSWEEVGTWFGGLVQPKIELTPEIRAKAAELTKDKSTDDEKIRAIYDFVSTRFRYIGIDLGLGRYSPHSAADVLANRYGDCKDKHTLFAALLQAVGIQAYPVLVSSKFRLDPAIPSAGLFDHVFTAIPRGDSFLFLDTTPEVAPFGLLISTIRDRQALVIPSAAPARLVTTPADPPFPGSEHFQIDSSIDKNGTLDAKMHLEERGDGELALRLAYRATPQNRWQELTQNLVNRMGFAGTVSDVSVAQPDDTAQPFWVAFSYHRTDFPDWKNHRIVLPSPPFFLPDLTEEQKLSKEPLPLGSLADITYDSTVKFPKDFSVVLPANVNKKTDFGEFSAKYSLDKLCVLHGTLHFKSFQREVSGNQRAEFSQFVKLIDETERSYIFVKGDFPSPVSPDSKVMGLALSKPVDAIPALEKALADDPDNRPALYMLSRAYIKTGRPKDAVSLLEKTLAGNPEDSQHLNIVLGEAYLGEKDADKATVAFKKGLGDDPQPVVLNEVAYSLAEANLKLSDALDFSSRSVKSIASKTMDISADDAQPSDFLLMSSLAAAWHTLGWIKFRLGDLPAAEKFLEASWQLDQNGEIGEHLVEVYEKLGQKEKAAALCNMANAAINFRPNPDPALQRKLSEAMARLRPFLKPSSATRPNSFHASSPDPHVALSDMRTMNIPFQAKLHGNAGRAEFVLSLTNGSNGAKVDNVAFVSGAEELRNAIAPLAAAKYMQSFPDETSTRILRKARLNCTIYDKSCVLILSTVMDASVPPSVPIPVIHNSN